MKIFNIQQAMTERVISAAKASESGGGASPVFQALKKITPEFGSERADSSAPSREDASFTLWNDSSGRADLSIGWYRGPSVPLGWGGFFDINFL